MEECQSWAEETAGGLWELETWMMKVDLEGRDWV